MREPTPGMQDYVRRNLWPKASQLLLASRIDTIGIRTPAIFLEEAALGYAWIPLNLKDSTSDAQATLKMWCVFMNSTCGALLLLNSRSRKLTYSMYNPKQFKSLSLPDPAKVDLQLASRVYDEMQYKELLRWSQMTKDPIRIQLDEAVSRLLGLDLGILADWRNRIAAEPTVQGQASL